MGFRKVKPSEGSDVPGYSEFLNRTSDPAAQKTVALRLMANFKKINK